MRVLLPTIRDPKQIGGTTTHLDMLSSGLEELDHVARVLYLGEAVPETVRKAGIVWPAGALNRLRRGWGMTYAAVVRGRALAAVTSAELARGDWDVLNVQEVYSVPAFRRLADRQGLPLVLTLHGYPLYESVSEGYATESRLARNYLMGAEMRALRMADAVVTVDTRLYDHVLRLAPELADRTTALMNFVDTSAFVQETDDREELRAKWDVPADRTVLFCPRRLVKKNGVVYPSLALASMPAEERSRYLLLHAGEGGERGAIERVVAEHGLEDEVRLLGGQDRHAIVELYRLCDIVLVPSVHSANVEEATSLAALEAMASGRPLIAGAVGGLAEMVADGVNGLLVPGGDAAALASAIGRLRSGRELGERLATAARDYVVANHSHLKAADDYLEVYARAGARVAPGEIVPVDVSDTPSEKPPDVEVVPGADVVPAVDVLPAADEEAAQASRPASVSVLGLAVDRVDLEEAARWVLERADEGQWARTRYAVSFNPEIVMRAQTDPAAAAALVEADLRYPDGVGVVWAAGRQGVDLERVPGIELAERVLAGAAEEGLSVFLLGAEPGVAEEAAERLRRRYAGLDVSGTRHGYFPSEEEGDVVGQIARSGSDLLLVALGAPRQEQFLRRHRGTLGVPVAMGVGGSFDVWAGRVRRAPSFVCGLGLEWAYRLVTQPTRVRRQAVLPRFAYRIALGSEDYGPGRGNRSSPVEPDGRSADSR